MSEPFRAVSLYQPYASLMAMGLKTIETRPWRMSYRGDIAICSSAHTRVRDLNSALEVPEIANSIRSGAEAGLLEKDGEDVILPYGVVLAVVELYDIKPTWEIVEKNLHCLESAFGDYANGRYGWFTRNLRRLTTPVPCKGKQGVWYLPDDVRHFVEDQIKRAA